MKTETKDKAGQEFLERQAEIIRQRNADRAVRDDLKSGWHPDVIKSADNVAKPFDANSVSRGPNANVPRIQKQELPGLEVIRELFDELATDLTDSKADYATLSLDEYFAPQKAAEAKVATLRHQLAAAELELAAVTRPHPHEAFRSLVCESEMRVNQLAGLLLVKLVDEKSREKFNIPADRLEEPVRKSLAIQFEDRLRRFVVNFYQRTHRINQPSDAQLNERVEQIINDVQQIVAENF
jgi:hypothetical protein